MKYLVALFGVVLAAWVCVLLYRHGIFAAPTDPLIEPDKFAWELFIKVNKPVDDNVVFWETWAPAGVVFSSPTQKPQFSAIRSHQFTLSQSIREDVSSGDSDINEVLLKATPKPCDDPSVMNVGGNQVMLNKETVDFIADNELYNIEGQIAMSNGKGIDFPKESIEIKARWQNIDRAEATTFYTHDCDGVLYGLVALHITSKETPNWVWATFEHVRPPQGDRHNPNQCSFLPCKDTFGAIPPTGLNRDPSPELIKLFAHSNWKDKEKWIKIWRNYRLVGSQVSFMEGITAIKLGNSVIEERQSSTSSCITCHSRATISDNVRLQPGPSFNASFNGCPDPCWFQDQDSKITFKQMDFVWSLLLAQSKNSPGNILPMDSLNYCGKNGVPTLPLSPSD